MSGNALITGHSRGLGNGFATELLARGWTVYGVSRHSAGDRLDPNAEWHEHCHDLRDHGGIADALDALLSGVERLDLVVLNAGILGEVRPLTDTPLSDLRRAMDINVWANKLIIDWLRGRGINVRQIVAMSSGAAVNGHKGWGGYALSKAALNMLIQLYARELEDVHLTALAPGLVDTAMQDYLCGEVDPERFPSVAKLRAARGTDAMPEPRTVATHVLDRLDELRGYPSGRFIDLRQI